MNIALFLGAGASKFAGHPTTKELMNIVRGRVADTKIDGRSISNITKIIVKNDNYTDVEKLYDGIDRMLRIRNDSPNVKPIFLVLHGSDSTFSGTLKELEHLKSVIRDILLESFVINDDTRGSIGSVYDRIWSVMRNGGTDEFAVFTTNYDSVMESYADTNDLEIVNGFKPYRHLSRIWDGKWARHTPQPPLYLTKLHGSVHWHENANGKIVETGGITQRNTRRDIMIAPTEGAKDYSKEPFLTLVDYFRESLKKVEMLLVIGFSYRDAEINEIIKRRLDEGMLLISVSPSASSDIERISDAKHQPVDWNNSQFVMLDSKIALCDKEFGPNTIEDVCSTLNAISLYFLNIKAKKSRIVS